MVMEEQEANLGLESESIPVPQVHNSLQQPCEEMLNQECNVPRGKPRLRKKALHALILKQMEFYFSDANLSKDRFLGTLIKSDPYVDLNVFLRFNKIRVLTDDVNRLAKALKSSTILSLSEDGTKVRRVTPINPRENCEACTIYVQGLPSEATHEWVSNLFSQYGAIAYVSIPRYKSNRKIKGFAFVEFDSVDGANECLKAFQEKHCTLPSHTAPHELLSITTFAEDEQTSESLPPIESTSDIDQTEIAEKRKIENEEVPKDGELEPKKARLEEPVQNEEDENEVRDETSKEFVEITETAPSQDEEDSEKEKTSTTDEKKKKKKKRKRKRQSKSEQIDVTDYGLQIMAKRDWKQLRNRYLQLQRNKMKQLKQHLQKARWNQWGGNYERKDRMDTEEIETKDPIEKSETSAPKFVFTPGVIVKFELDEPCSNPKSFKLELRSDTAVKYIDVQEGTTEAFIRCENSESAKAFAEKYSEKKSLRILDGDEEKTYWDKILQDREERLNKKDRMKQRGREKLLKKAEKELGKHIKFDEV